MDLFLEGGSANRMRLTRSVRCAEGAAPRTMGGINLLQRGAVCGSREGWVNEASVHESASLMKLVALTFAR